MQATVAKSEKLKKTLNVKIPYSAVSTQVDKKVAELAKTVKLPGFRPGKVPVSVIKKNYGDSVMAEAIERAVQESTIQAIEQNNFKPAMRPKVDMQNFEEGKDLEYTLEFEVLPDVPEVDFAKIELEEWQTDISDAEIEEGLTRLADQMKQFETVDRAAKNGDSVIIDFVGKMDGEPFAGGTGTDVQLIIGSNYFIPGFEEKLIGAKAGDTPVLDLTFPKEYHSKQLAGKATSFEVTVKEVKQPKDRAIDDAMAKELGFDDLAKLKEMMKAQFEKDYGGLTRTRLKKDLFDHLDNTLTFEVPESMLEAEFGAIWQQFEHSEEFKNATKPKAELEKEYRRMAERRVRLGILLASLGEKQKIQVGDDELKNAVFAQARQYPGQEKQVVEFYQKNPQAIESLRGPILEEKVVEYLLGVVKKKAKKVAPKDWHENPVHGEEGHVHGPDCNH